MHGKARHSGPRSAADRRRQTSRARGRSAARDRMLLDATDYSDLAVPSVQNASWEREIWSCPSPNAKDQGQRGMQKTGVGVGAGSDGRCAMWRAGLGWFEEYCPVARLIYCAASSVGQSGSQGTAYMRDTLVST